MELNTEIFNHRSESIDYIELVNQIVDPEVKDLDLLVNSISELLKKPDFDLIIGDLQYYYLKLSTELYFMVDKLKQFEIYTALAKSNQTESYNEAYLSESVASDKKPAVAELQIRAENASKKQSLINTVYNSAFKAVKSKIDAGNNLADTLKNIIKVKTNIDFTNQQSENNFIRRG